MKDTDRKAYNIVKSNSFAYNPARINVGSIGYYKGSENVIVSSLYEVFQTDNYVNDRFLWHWFKSDEFPRWIEKLQEGSVRLYFYYDKLCECQLYMSSVEEQEKIASFLDNLDCLITLHQCKCDNTKIIIYIAWEQRKLGELGSLKNGMNFSKDAMGIGFPFVNLQNIFGNNVIDVTNLGKATASDSQLKDYNLLNGDVLFVRSSVKLEGVGEAALVPQNLENTTYSGFIIRFRDEYGLDNNFKRFIFGIEAVRNQIMAQATNSANKNISQTVLENLCLKIPSKSEQEKIGLYFSNFDTLITLHQQKYIFAKYVSKYAKNDILEAESASVGGSRTSFWKKEIFNMGMMTVYHGGYKAVEQPEIRKGRNTKDFGTGFYCTIIKEQAQRWARRYDTKVVSIYDVRMEADLNIKEFKEMTEEWLDFIVACRSGLSHDYDIVIGAMADDQIYNYVSDYMDGVITREQFWVLAKFKYPTHQIAFCTERSLKCLEYRDCEVL